MRAFTLSVSIPSPNGYDNTFNAAKVWHYLLSFQASCFLSFDSSRNFLFELSFGRTNAS